MTTNQPKWRIISNLGDASPIQYGGFFVYEDMTGIYPPEATLLEVYDEDKKPRWIAYRFMCDRLKKAENNSRLYLIPFEYDSTWSHPMPQYNVWFADSLEAIASYQGCTPADIRVLLTSDDAVKLARGYRMIGEYHGFDNLDSYPLTYTSEAEVKKAFRKELTWLKNQKRG